MPLKKLLAAVTVLMAKILNRVLAKKTMMTLRRIAVKMAKILSRVLVKMAKMILTRIAVKMGKITLKSVELFQEMKKFKPSLKT